MTAASGSAAPDATTRAVAWSAWLDLAAADAVAHLERAGIPCVLLKGAAVARWLYADHTPRPYRDIDLLVPFAEFAAAEAALTGLGYVHRLAGAAACEFGSYEKDLVGPQGACIDLHHRVVGVADPPERCWDVLATHTTPLELMPGRVVSVLDLPARTAHLALHAAQAGLVDTKAVEDLRRGLDQLPPSLWREARTVAVELGAEEAFGGGLRLLPAGQALADAMAIPRPRSVEVRLRTASAPQNSLAIDRLARTPGLAAKVALVARKLWPTAVFLRSQYPAARHGPLGRVVARLLHLGRVAVNLPAAMAAWRRARRGA